jgi:hypothetical protein
VRRALLALALAALLVPQAASADRRASGSTSRAMWRAADPQHRCVHRRGRISSVRRAHRRFGTVTIADDQCGNGTVLLRTRRHSRRWQRVASGSDWGADLTIDCAREFPGVPVAALRDLLGPELCPAEGPMRACGERTYAPRSGGFALILERLRAHRVSCSAAARIGGAYYAGDAIPRGWRCATSDAEHWTACVRGRRRLRFFFGGDAG